MSGVWLGANLRTNTDRHVFERDIIDLYVYMFLQNSVHDTKLSKRCSVIQL